MSIPFPHPGCLSVTTRALQHTLFVQYMLLCLIRSASRLYTGGVHHDTGLSANGLGWKISSESAPNDTVSTVGPAYLSPVDSEFVSVFICYVSLCNKGNSLSEVEVDLFLGVDSSDFQQAHAVVLVSETTLESEDSGLNVKLGGSLSF